TRPRASRRASRYVLVLRPAGGETWPADQTFTISWRSHVVGENPATARVSIQLYNTTTSATTTITSSQPAAGQYSWTVPSDQAPGSYQIKITRNDYPTVIGFSNTFTITAAIHVYYVNDGTVEHPGIDWTTARGDDANDGLHPYSPKASIAAVLRSYTLGPGDVIMVDEGTYTLSTNTILDSGSQGYTIEGFHNTSYPN